MEPISWNDMARFAQQPHGSYYPKNPPTPMSMAQHQIAPMSAAQQKQKYRIETHSKILPYVVRDHSWNFDSHDGTNFGKYKTDAPQAYAADVEYELPHPTNIPTEADPLLPCTPAEEIEWAQEKSAAAAAGLPKPDAWCESSVPDPDPVDADADQAATDAATAAENTGAEAAANGTVATPPAAGATAHKKTKANVPKSAHAPKAASTNPKSKAKSAEKEFEEKKAKKEAAKQNSAASKKTAETQAREIVTAPIKEKDMTAAIDHDEKSHASTKKEDEHPVDPNDVVPASHQDAPKPVPKKVEKILEIMKDPKVEAKKAGISAKLDTNANKTNNSPTVSKLKADS